MIGDRLRGVLDAHRPRAAIAPPAAPSQAFDGLSVSSALGGEWLADATTRCLVVERRVPGERVYGMHQVAALAEQLDGASAEAPLLTGGEPARPPFLFFDLETTGLSGGAGTYAFLVGCGWFEHDGSFATRQYLLAHQGHERPLLSRVSGELSRAGALVSFNGKSFDAPVLETRYQFHRLEWHGATLPHLDVLHPARRFWGAGECSLTALERQVLGARRDDDVSGFEIPGRYFAYVRSGDARPLAAVLEHNRFDLLSLAGLTARLLHLLACGAAAACTAAEAVALGWAYARAGRDGCAHQAYQAALELSCDRSADQLDALRGLAMLARRARRYEEAASVWRRLLELPALPPRVAREATEALAIHHEHRARDLNAARTFALRSLEAGAPPAWEAAVRHRVARIERKLGRVANLGTDARQTVLRLEA